MSNDIQVVENNFVNMRRMKAHNGEMVYTVKHGAVTVQLNRDKAEFICRMLASWLELDVEKKEVMNLIKKKANINSARTNHLGA